ncbi:MAG: hypothetical protein GXP62_08800 [Oligoflexia bacterium]|nr:hypothetical protein [Oligoflexia bacterium]
MIHTLSIQAQLVRRTPDMGVFMGAIARAMGHGRPRPWPSDPQDRDT